MDTSQITDELKEKAKACETTSELLALMQEEGYELTDEQLEAVSGGMATGWTHWDNA